MTALTLKQACEQKLAQDREHRANARRDLALQTWRANPKNWTARKQREEATA
jgi:hypothetical protein